MGVVPFPWTGWGNSVGGRNLGTMKKAKRGTKVVNPVFRSIGIRRLFACKDGRTVMTCPNPDCGYSALYLGSVDTEDVLNSWGNENHRVVYLRFECRGCGRELSLCLDSIPPPVSAWDGEVVGDCVIQVSWAHTANHVFTMCKERLFDESSAGTGLWLLYAGPHGEFPLALVEGNTIADAEQFVRTSDDPELQELLESERELREVAEMPVGSVPGDPDAPHFYVEDMYGWFTCGGVDDDIPTFYKPDSIRKPAAPKTKPYRKT